MRWTIAIALAATLSASAADGATRWNQWRGPTRDGIVAGTPWPDKLSEDTLARTWRIELGPSYSGPVLSEKAVFTTETRDSRDEVVHAYDRQTGRELWKAQWAGAMSVPFFAWSNGSWIRSTPAYVGTSLYVAGMRDVLVCLDGATGAEKWRVDFVTECKSELPAFGFVCSPLVDGNDIYVQAGASLAKLDSQTGKLIWRTLKDEGGMNGSAFSSPMIATLAGVRQVVVQTREKLAGVDLDTGTVLWTREVPSFRGMNILTPVIVGDSVFTSSYQNKSWLFKPSKTDEKFTVEPVWSNMIKGYMSTPVNIDGHAYLHLQNQRFTCIDLKTGQARWTTRPFGQYWSLVAQGDRILALDQRGILRLIRANPEKFDLLDEREVASDNTWAHVAVDGDEVYVRELKALTAYRWQRTVR